MASRKLSDGRTRRGILIAGSSLLAGACTSLASKESLLSESAEVGLSDDPRMVAEALEKLATFEDLRSGGRGDIACGEWLEGLLQQQGFDVRRQVFETPYFEPSTSLLRAGSIEAPVYPQGIVVPTGPGGVIGRLQLWRTAGDVVDPEGAIVLMLLPSARYSKLADPALKAAIEPISRGGAAAIVLITSGPSGERILLNADPKGPAYPQPMAVMGPKDAQPLYALAQRGLTATLVTDGTGGTRPAFNLIAEINRPGPRIVISTPRSGWGPCMAERGPGIAVFCALAQTLPQAFPEHSWTFLANSGHEYDNLGSHHVIANGAPSPANTKLWFHLGAGFAARDFHEVGSQLYPLKSADPQRFLVSSEAFVPTLQETFAGLPGLEVPYPARMGSGGELAEILAAGYPRALGMMGNHRFHHASSDTVDKTEPELVLPVLKAVRSTLHRLA